MGKNIEIETKAILTKEEYKKLLPYFLDSKPFTQINYYLDTKDYKILSKNAGLRMRNEHDYFELTLKVKFNDSKLEINQKISAKEADLLKNCGVFPQGDVLNEVNKIINDSSEKIYCFGKLENTRIERRDEGDLLCLDKSSYCGITDYEIEIESSSIAKGVDHLRKILSTYKIEYKENRINKIQRVLNAVKN